jgi:hypothetical protein
VDPVANVTAGANVPAPDDAMSAEPKRAADWPHWPDRGTGRPRRDRLERRLFVDSERQAELALAQETLGRIEHAVAAKAAEVERLEHALGQMNGSKRTTYLVFAWAPTGYAFHEGEGDPPPVGARVTVNGREHAVAKLARSPLPGDGRLCAYLEPA